MTYPYNPANDARNAVFDPEQVKASLLQHVKQVSPTIDEAQARAAIAGRVDDITNAGQFIDGRRYEELSYMATVLVGGTPEQAVRAKLAQTGQIVPFEALPEPVSQTLRQIGVDESTTAEALAIFYPHLTPQQRIEKYKQVLEMPDAALAPDYAQPRQGYGQLSPEQIAAIKQKSTQFGVVQTPKGNVFGNAG